MKCIGCGITIPDLPEDASFEEMLCDYCLNFYEMETEIENMERGTDYDD